MMRITIFLKKGGKDMKSFKRIVSIVLIFTLTFTLISTAFLEVANAADILDEGEPNDTPVFAMTAKVGEIYEGKHADSDDEDWFKLEFANVETGMLEIRGAYVNSIGEIVNSANLQIDLSFRSYNGKGDENFDFITSAHLTSSGVQCLYYPIEAKRNFNIRIKKNKPEGKYNHYQFTIKSRRGYILEKDEWYQIDENGNKEKKLPAAGAPWYFAGQSGTFEKGWNRVFSGGDSRWYFIDKVSNSMRTGWAQDSGKWYYMNSNGAMQTGWEKVSGTWYYMARSGAMQTGWNKVGNAWYYMSGSGAMQTGWNRVGSTWYYMSGSGAMQTGWNKVGGKWYYMNNSGAMQTGWTKVSGKWYCMNNSGAMQTGWTKVGGAWYYMNSSGAMQTGWVKLGGSWYYLKSSGAMQTGKANIGGKSYYFDSSGRMR